jgi:N-acetylneuraminate synthase
MKNIFKNLFILDLANNHFGDLQHAKKIIDNFSKIINKFKINACIKFQFRDLDSYIHPNFRKDKKNKFVKRFTSTRLEIDELKLLFKYVKSKGIKTCCTPFDEKSIEIIEEFKFDFLKIASVSSNDWTLIERSVENNIPKIISTGGRSLNEIDKIFNFFEQKNEKFAIMHCVSIYPTEDRYSELHTITKLLTRFNNQIEIGWSTHEDPNNLLIGPIAYSLGARIFEKHIGINSRKYKLNKYSISPSLFEKYLEKINLTKDIIGDEKSKVVTQIENKTLSSLERGMYLRKNVKKNEFLSYENIYFAFPKIKNQISSSGFSFLHKKHKILKDLLKDKPIKISDVKTIENKKIINLTNYIHEARSILRSNKINLGSHFDLEISHHYGINKFRNYGCFLFNCINRKYAKKIVLLFSNQKHPLHKHRLKEETFQILSGVLESTLNGKTSKLFPGDTILVKPGVWHNFRALDEPCIFEEVSTTSFPDDSFYKDMSINKLNREQRKTRLSNFNTSELDLKLND